MSKIKSIKYQIQGILSSKLCIGESRHESKIALKGQRLDGIYSWSTYKNYCTAATAFGRWAKERYGCRSVQDMKYYVPDYLKYRIKKNVSAWTVSRDASALAKLYGCSVPDFGVKLPERKRSDVKRSRGEVKGFAEEKHQGLVNFLKGTGLRKHEVLNVKKENVFESDGSLWVEVEQGKGGKQRFAKVLPEYEKAVFALVKHIKSPDEKIFDPKGVPDRTPAHRYRAEYASAWYSKLARDKIPKKDRYNCRGDKAGITYDKAAMLEVSRYLGHNRVSVMADSYLYKLNNEDS